jgi:ABC-2 type transport system ATP-binding protein
MNMSDISIQTNNLTRDFGDLRAVDGITLSIPSGIVFGFLGPNGSGKTTTIRLLLGLLQPTAGSAHVLGFDTVHQADEIRQGCGALLEYNGLYERLSAEDNLEFFGRIWRLPAEERKARIQELLESIGLWERRKEIVGNWSTGMRQKLAVARVLLHHPRLVFLDEPSAGLDPVASAALRDDLEQLVRKEGLTVFLTTHNLAEAERLCDQVAVIRKGKLLAVGSPEDLKRRQQHNRVIVSGRGFTPQVLQTVEAMDQISEIHLENNRLIATLREDISNASLVQVLVNAGVEIEEVSREKANLEEVFLALVEEEHD